MFKKEHSFGGNQGFLFVVVVVVVVVIVAVVVVIDGCCHVCVHSNVVVRSFLHGYGYQRGY